MEESNRFDNEGILDTQKGVALTPAETNIFRELMTAKTHKEIGECFAIKPKTVKYHLTNILAKLGMKCRRELMAYYMEEMERRYIEEIRELRDAVNSLQNKLQGPGL